MAGLRADLADERLAGCALVEALKEVRLLWATKVMAAEDSAAEALAAERRARASDAAAAAAQVEALERKLAAASKPQAV